MTLKPGAELEFLECGEIKEFWEGGGTSIYFLNFLNRYKSKNLIFESLWGQRLPKLQRGSVPSEALYVAGELEENVSLKTGI